MIMFSKKKKEEKEPNHKLTLATAIFLIVLILFCFIDTLKDLANGTPEVTIFMSIFMGGCIIGLLWVIWYIIKRMKAERQKQ